MCCLPVIRYITFFVGSHTKLLITFRSALTDLLKVSSFQASPLQMWRSVANEDQKLGGLQLQGLSAESALPSILMPKDKNSKDF
jgi:hypothetical protein